MSWKLFSWWKKRGKKNKTTPSLSVQVHGIDVNRSNSYDQTALDLVKQFTKSRAARELKHVLAEALASVTARAVCDYHGDPLDPLSLTFCEDEIISVLEKNADGRWKGVIVGERRSNLATPRSGYFPSSAVVVVPATVGGMNRPNKPSQGKKVAPPTVPTVPTEGSSSTTQRHSGSSFGSGSSGLGSDNRSSLGSVVADDTFPPPPSPNRLADTQHVACDHSGVYANRFPGGIPSQSPEQPTYTAVPFSGMQGQPAQLMNHMMRRGVNSVPPSHLYPSDNREYYAMTATTQYQHQLSLEDQGIDVTQSPGRDSPGSSGSGSSGGCRHSTTSLDSGRASGSVSEGRSGHSYGQVPSGHRLSGQSYESSHSGGSLRHSYPSSSSCSSGSLERGEDAGICSLNVAEMLMAGIADHDVLNAWLTDLHYEEYYHLFIQAGYDMPTISRMTPEDLTAIGIKKPNHRKKLKAEIAQLNISDALPDYIPPNLEEWLHMLRLEEYFPTLNAQGYQSVEQMTQLAWEDLEDIGIVKLGHQKKIILAIKRVKDILAGKRVPACPLDPRYAPQYQTQEITITPTATGHSPVQEGYHNISEFRTFHQVPTRIPRWEMGESNYYMHGAGGQQAFAAHCFTDQAFYQPDVIPVQGYPVGWPQRSFDDGDITPTNEVMCLQEGGGGAGGGTLPRPKGMVKPRPIAKIMANKTRPIDASAGPMYIEDFHKPTLVECYKSLPRDPMQRDKYFEGGQGANKGAYWTGTLKKTHPPLPPKRTNSVKETAEFVSKDSLDSEGGDITSNVPIEANVVEQQPLFSVEGSYEDILPPPPSIATDDNFGSDTSDSPSSGGSTSVCSVRERFEVAQSKQQCNTLPRTLPKSASSSSSQSQRSSRDPSPGGGSDLSDSELSSATLFQQRRNGSDASFKSTSSTESDSMPFANENAGTIKQRATRPHPTLSVMEGGKGPEEEGSGMPQPPRLMGRRAPGSRALESGDVLNDIGSMLADLTNELDAMLEEERQQGNM